MPSTVKRQPRTYGGVSGEERAALRRERLLDAGLERFGVDGWAAAGVKDICREAGLTDRYFYESFDDRLALFTAVFDRATAQLLERVALAVAAVEPEPRTQIAAAIETFVAALAADQRVARVIFREAGAAGAEADAHMRATLRQFAALIVETARPHLSGDVSEHVLRMGSLALVGAMERVIVDWQDGQLDASLEDMTGYLVEFFLAAAPTFGLE
jgi:AcrR family transcriptional regulator